MQSYGSLREMYAMEVMPYYLAMGISEEQFWTMNPHRFKPYKEAYRLKRRQIDEQQFYLAQYMFEAISTALGNINFGKHKKSHNYMGDMRKDPILESARYSSGNITDEERIEGTKELFSQLEGLKSAFERNNPSSNEIDTDSHK